VAGSVKVKNDKWRNLRVKLLRIMDQNTLVIGVLGSDGDAERKDEGVSGISAARLAAVHEYGATIKHPGGTPYLFSDGFDLDFNGRGVFLPKGDKRATGVTKAHEIKIPSRSFLRSTADENARTYAGAISRGLGRTVDGKTTIEQVLGLVGEKVVADVNRRIRAGLTPDIKAATKRRKGSSKPLIDSGQLVNSITYEVRKTGDTR
jgi:hypothetical protein